MPKKPTTYFPPNALARSGDTDPFMYLGNPLRGLSPSRVAALLEQGERGEWREPQWLFRMICKVDADVLTIRKRRLSAIRKLSWNVKVTSAKTAALGPQGEALAAAQQAYLQSFYESIENLMDAVEHLATAPLAGFAHVSLQGTRLEPLDQWWWLRNGSYGAWVMNPELKMATAIGAPDEAIANPADWISLEEETPVIWIAILKYVRANASQKWWDKFCEVFSKRGTIITAPLNVAPEKLAEFQANAEKCAVGGSGALPGGSTVQSTNAITGGAMPYEAHMRFLRESVILVGTGGLLTSLAGGSAIGGGGPAAEQGDVFDTIAGADAARISEAFQVKLDKPRLAAQFPGQPVLAYFELAAEEATNPSALLDDAVKAKNAGFDMDAEELSEKTGYTLTRTVVPPAQNSMAIDGYRQLSTAIDPSLRNRRAGKLVNAGGFEAGTPDAANVQKQLKALEDAALKEFGPAYKEMLQPFLDQVKDATTPEELQAALDAFQAKPEARKALADIVARTVMPAALRGQALDLTARVALKPLPFEEALKFWDMKTTDAGKLANATWKQAQTYGMKVAGMTEQSALEAIKADIGSVVAGNSTVADFVKTAADKYGIQSPLAETIVRTNVQTAFQWGHYQRLDAVKQELPIWGLDVVNDGATSATCRRLLTADGRRMAWYADDPIWDTMYPPLHFNCRTTVVPFESVEEAEAQGFAVMDTRPRSGKDGGEIMPAKGFEMNVGRVPLLSDVLEAVK